MRYALLFSIAALSACRNSPDDVFANLPDCYHIHEHTYTHQWSYSENYETYAWVRGVRIYLHDDLVALADLDTLFCVDSTGAWQESCSEGFTEESYGGTQVDLVLGDTSSGALWPDYVSWTFGISSPYDAPFIAGQNDTDRDGEIDTADSERNMGLQIAWANADESAEGDGATSADFYVDYWAFDQLCAEEAAADPDDALDEGDCWAQVDEPQAPGEVGDHWSPESDIVQSDAQDCAGS